MRFICGTQALHRELEERLSRVSRDRGHDPLQLVLRRQRRALRGAARRTRTPSSPTQLNHASIIDGIRLCKAQRLRYANGDMDELEARLVDAADARYRLDRDRRRVLDGRLPRPARPDLRSGRAPRRARHGRRLSRGRRARRRRAAARPSATASSIASTSSPARSARRSAARAAATSPAAREIVELLRQRARPYLFSNSLAPPVVGASLRRSSSSSAPTSCATVCSTTPPAFAQRMIELGFDVLPGEHPIVPVMIGDEIAAARLSATLVELGVYAVSFSYPVVPRGTARIRTQMSAAHTAEDLDFAVAAFSQAREMLGAG